MRQLTMFALLVAIFATSSARADEPAKPQPVPKTVNHYATLVVAAVAAVNGGPTGGGLIALCYEQERSKMSFELCAAISLDNHLTVTGETSGAIFRKWQRVSLGVGLVAMSEYAHEGHFVGVAPTVNLVIPLHHVVDITAEVGGGPQWKVAVGSDPRFLNPPEFGHVRGVAFGMLGLVIKLYP
ncbi:MAG: hypothetical protein EXS55_03055 [Candidatus Magasanikbacteria bacterium]|nr:hypothetical protein [Candidatus Magasanikbacteria bacterium]